MIKIGSKAPPVTADSSEGQTTLPPKNSWSVIHYYLGDFQPSSASDILALEGARARFAAYGAKVYGVSADSAATHIAWLLSLKDHKKDGNIGIPLVSDIDGRFARLYSVSATERDMNKNEKVTAIIDDNGILRALHRHSYNSGINVTELERELLSLKAAKAQSGQTPAGWTPGDEIMEHPPRSLATAKNNISDRTAQGMRCVDWYICYRSDTPGV